MIIKYLLCVWFFLPLPEWILLSQDCPKLQSRSMCIKQAGEIWRVYTKIQLGTSKTSSEKLGRNLYIFGENMNIKIWTSKMYGMASCFSWYLP